MKKFVPIAILLFLLVVSIAFAGVILPFGPETSRITGSINYSVIGKYYAVFDHYAGHITIDDKDDTVKLVYLEILSNSIRSKHPSLDKIVKSPRLLDVEKFPKIAFESKSITKTKNGYQVVGELTLHGVSIEIASPFTVETGPYGELRLKGEWVIERKKFGIIWNKLLDKGGILVGDHVTVDWQIIAPKGKG